MVTVKSVPERDLSTVRELVKIGLALSSEKRLDRILELIVKEACRFTCADGGALYIRDMDKDVLDFAIIRNASLEIRMGGSGAEIGWPPVPLKNEDKSGNLKNVSAYCANTGKSISIKDVYEAEGYDFSGAKAFDAKTGFRSKSMLVIPMRDHEDTVIGVLQLINAQDTTTGEVVEFPPEEIDIIESLASQAAVAITKMRLIKGLEELMDSFVQSIATAIDEKSPYTTGHIERVALITGRLAEAISETKEGNLAAKSFSPDEMKELRMAAWMHDVGKISIPEYVIDKATKLETIFDRIELVRYRIELMKREREIRQQTRGLTQEPEDSENAGASLTPEEMEEHLVFLEKVNKGGEFLHDETKEKIKALAALSFEMNGQPLPFLSENEVMNLCIDRGTLSSDERTIIHNHVSVTGKMLEKLPFPKILSRVARYAAMHHEKLNGSGYPFGLTADEIPLQARILAVADIFEALCAADRPYKLGKRLSEAMKILEFMVKDGELDGDICDLIVESGIVIAYARENLSKRQQDDFEWNGKKYSLKEM